MIPSLQMRKAQIVARTKSKLNSNHISLLHNSQDLNLDMTHALFCCQSSPDLLYTFSLKLYMFYVFALCHNFFKWQGKKIEEEFNVVSTRWARQLFLLSVWSGEQMHLPGESLSVNSHRHRKASPRQSCTQCHGSPKRSIYSPNHRGLGEPGTHVPKASR